MSIRPGAILFALLMSACGGAPAPPGVVQESSTGKSNLWIIFNPDAPQNQDFGGMFDCLINHSDYNNLIQSWDGSSWHGNTLKFDANANMIKAPNYNGGYLFNPNPASLVQFLFDQGRHPGNGDLILLVTSNNCAQAYVGGADPNGQTVTVYGHTMTVYPATIVGGDVACAQRVAMHEVYESATDGHAADCCTGQTTIDGVNGYPNQAQCTRNWNTYGPVGWGSYTFSCPNHRNYTGQLVQPWPHEYDPSYCKPVSVGTLAPPPAVPSPGLQNRRRRRGRHGPRVPIRLAICGSVEWNRELSTQHLRLVLRRHPGRRWRWNQGRGLFLRR